jgi:uncharacterized protein (DUF58 family)
MFATGRLIALAAFGALVMLPGAWNGRLLAVGAVYNVALAAAVGIDYALLRRRGSFPVAVTRECHDVLSLGTGNVVSVSVRNTGSARVRIAVKDLPPPGLPHDSRPFSVTLEPGRGAVSRYSVIPTGKGDYEFGDIAVRTWSPLGLLMSQHLAPASRRVRVYPDVKAVSRYDLLARRGRLAEAGIRAARYRGRGTEFESLRAYMPDDDSRQIDWKATARRHQLISAQFQAERSQNVFLVLDAGRMMAGRVGPMTKLDHAINAALMCAYVAAEMGDRVGLLAFAARVRAYIPARRGRRQVFHLLEDLYRLEPELVEPDYDAAFHYLALRQRRRSLVIVFTDLVDRDSSATLLEHIGALHPHHLVLCVTLADAEVLALARAVPNQAEDVYQKAVALQVLADREAALTYLRRRGVHVVDAPADGLTAAAINRYLELKSRSLV